MNQVEATERCRFQISVAVGIRLIPVQYTTRFRVDAVLRTSGSPARVMPGAAFLISPSALA